MARTMSLTQDHTVTISTGHDGSSSRPTSSSYVVRPRRHSESNFSLDKSRPKSFSNLLAAHDSASKDVCQYQIDDSFLTRSTGRRPKDNDVAALIEFLRNNAPPPDNFMSVPEPTDEDRGRWSKIKLVGKRGKSTPRSQSQIRLPDSAIASSTIGGHRHMAISIPLEVSPFGDTPRSQYPVYLKDDSSRGSTPLGAPTFTFMNDKGTVTVLRTVAEDREPTTPDSPETSGGSLPISSYYRDHRPAGSRSQSRGSTNTTVSKTPIFDQYRTIRDSSEQPASASSSKSFQRSLYPARGSSIPNRANQPPSIDGMIASSTPASPEGPQLRVSTETITDAPTLQRPKSGANQGKVKRLPTPLLFGGEPVGGLIHARADLAAPMTPALAESPLLPPEHNSAPPSPSGRSRRDIVRDRKRRDIERMRSGRSKKGDADAKASKDASGETKAVSRPTLCAIVTVFDFEPSGESEVQKDETNTVKPTKSLESFATALASPLNEKTAEETELDGESSQKRTLDRTSLSRRREWNENKEQERKLREARAAARVKAKQLVAAGLPYEYAKSSQADEEILRLYETYRDQRLREMERRVRRLERNGDVWLRALVPVLDTMSKQVMAGHDCEDYTSDETTTGKARAGSKRKAKFSQSQLLEELARRKREEKGAAVPNGEDESGMGGIEPLMRELAADGGKKPVAAAV